MAAKKLTGKQEAFAQGVFAGLSQSAAYRQAYSADRMLLDSVHHHASLLANNVMVASRIAELRAAAEAAIVADVVWDRRELVRAAERGLAGSADANQWSAYNGSLQIIGKVTGLLADRVEHSGTISHALDAATEATLRDLVDRRRALESGGTGPAGLVIDVAPSSSGGRDGSDSDSNGFSGNA